MVGESEQVSGIMSGYMHLDTHVRRRGTNEPERCANVDLHNDVERVIGRRVEHAVIREASIVYDVVKFTVFPV